MPYYLLLIVILLSPPAFADSLEGVITRKSDHCAPVSKYLISIRKQLDNLSLENVTTASAEEQKAILKLLQDLDIKFTLKQFKNQVNQQSTSAQTYEYWNVTTNGEIEFDSEDSVRKAFIALNKAGYKTNMDVSSSTPSMCR